MTEIPKQFSGDIKGSAAPDQHVQVELQVVATPDVLPGSTTESLAFSGQDGAETSKAVGRHAVDSMLRGDSPSTRLPFEEKYGIARTTAFGRIHKS